MAKTETIRFEDGDYWEFKTYMTVAQERLWVQHAMDAQVTYRNPDSGVLDQLARRMDALVVAQSVNWSYGPVDLNTFYEIPSHHYAEVASRMGDLYSPLVVKSIERGLQIYSSLSSPQGE